MSFLKFASFLSKVTIEVGRNFFLVHVPVASPDCNTAKLHNECLENSLFMLSPFFKARADTLPGEANQWKFSLPQKSHHRIKTPSSKLTILVSSCWKKNFIRNNNAHNFFILSLVFLKLLIVSVAFFLGHPVY